MSRKRTTQYRGGDRPRFRQQARPANEPTYLRWPHTGIAVLVILSAIALLSMASIPQ